MSENGQTARRLVRWFTLGSGPLKRGSDRVQVAARVLLLIVVLTAAPVALAVATAIGSHTRDLADSQSADRRQVDATLLQDTPPGRDTTDAMARTAVPASWTAPDGSERDGAVRVRAAAKAGTTVSVWVDEAGRLTTRPLGRTDVVSRAVTHGLATFLGISVLATLGHVTLCRLLDRRRLRRWATDWAVVEPVWSRKVP